ncbi:MAG: magnesium/cobalt transporter CorA [Anaerolineae bacterium]
MSNRTLSLNGITWTDIRSPTAQDIEDLREQFPFFHPLDLEDLLSKTEGPKIDEYENYLFTVMHFPVFKKATRRLGRGEVDIFVGRGFLVTASDGELKPLVEDFDEAEKDEGIRRQLMGRGSYYLLYLLIDDLVDYCFPILDKVNHNIEGIEQTIFDGNAKEIVREISIVRRNLINYRRTIKPQMRVIASLGRKDWEFLRGDLDVYWGDVSDHIVQIWERLEDLWEVIEGLNRTLESLTSHRLNEVMKILTIFSVIMLPLSVISGIYGMNIRQLPLASHPMSFIAIIAVMAAIVVGMLAYFKREGWL